MIYIIRAGLCGLVKIGTAIDPQGRLKALQTGHYESLHIIRLLEGNHERESFFHRQFRGWHIRHEWYHFDDSMMTYEPPEIQEQTAKYDPMYDFKGRDIWK